MFARRGVPRPCHMVSESLYTNKFQQNNFGIYFKNLNTGEIEVGIEKFKILARTKELPLPVFSDQEYSEEIRLKYRFLDLRRNKIHNNIISIDTEEDFIEAQKFIHD